MGRYLFQGLNVATVGDFGPLRSPLILQQWIERRGGFWSKNITHLTTHLICSKDAFKRNVGIVRMARYKNVPIVSYDWFEDSNRTGILQYAQGEYLVENAIKNAKKRKKIRRLEKEVKIQLELEAFEEECQELKKLLCSDRYQIHRDITGFAYNIILFRLDILANTSERCILKLCSTHEVPKGYTCLLIHHIPGQRPESTVLTNKRCDWFTALAAFEKAFKERTKIEWDDRLKWKVSDGEAFVYARPKKGEPVGFMADDGVDWCRTA
ncbi:MAG: hypothetical protein Q9169_004609 [Polycauliona sp. 2 TL-2023]